MAGGDVAKADREALTAWLLADPRHAEAYANVEQLWDAAGDIPELKERGETAARRLTRRDLGKGAGAALVAFAGWRYLETHPFADLRTAKGARRTKRLADGSTLELSAGTSLSIAFGGAERAVELHDGEAFFTVAPDPARPFVVRAGASEIRALGAAFDVRIDGGEGRVAVTEHAVALRMGAARIEIEAGEQGLFGAGGLGPVGPAETAQLSWREGRLTFARAPLGTVVAEVNRWREGRLVVLDGALAARPVTLIVDLARLETVLPRLAEVLPVRFVSVTPWLTFILASG